MMRFLPVVMNQVAPPGIEVIDLLLILVLATLALQALTFVGSMLLRLLETVLFPVLLILLLLLIAAML